MASASNGDLQPRAKGRRIEEPDVFDLKHFKFIIAIFGPLLNLFVHCLIGYNAVIYFHRFLWWRYTSDISATAQLFTLPLTIGYCFFLTLCIWSYWMVYLTSPGSVPKGWSNVDPETGESRTTETTFDGRVRYCKKCQCHKPDRAHHCSVCDKCVLKMDHHCPWVANCVGLHNHKYFILFVSYTAICAVYYDLTITLRFFTVMKETKGTDTFFLGSYIIVNSFLFVLGLFSLWHLYLASANTTTLEFEYAKPQPYNLGWRRNMEMVFGPNRKTWWLPVNPNLQVDGLTWTLAYKQYRRVQTVEETDIEMGAKEDIPVVAESDI